MVCKHMDCFNCPEKNCVLDNKELENITEVAEREKRKSYNKAYYLKHRDDLKKRARLRARKNKEEQNYRACKHCGKKIDLKKGACFIARSIFAPGNVSKTIFLRRLKRM